jgi:hypothetical protein
VKLREIESWGVKLRVFEDQGGYFKKGGSSGGSCEVSPKIFIYMAKTNIYMQKQNKQK